MTKPLKIFENLYVSLNSLPDGTWCFWWDSILKYHFEGIEPEIEPSDVYAVAFWNSLKAQIILGNTDRRSETSAKNGAKSNGRPVEKK